MEAFPAFEGVDYTMRGAKLRDAVRRGDVRSLLNDEIVPKAHIAVYLDLYSRTLTQQESETLPPDLGLNYDDLCAVFDRPNVDDRKRGRPKKEQSGWSDDRLIAYEMHKMLAVKNPPASSPTEAARQIIESGRSPARPTTEIDSQIKRLVRQFRKYYSS